MSYVRKLLSLLHCLVNAFFTFVVSFLVTLSVPYQISRSIKSRPTLYRGDSQKLWKSSWKVTNVFWPTAGHPVPELFIQFPKFAEHFLVIRIFESFKELLCTLQVPLFRIYRLRIILSDRTAEVKLYMVIPLDINVNSFKEMVSISM